MVATCFSSTMVSLNRPWCSWFYVRYLLLYKISSSSSRIEWITAVSDFVSFFRACVCRPFVSSQEPGSWMLNEVSSPEVDKLVDAFLGMTTILKSGNLTLSSGNMELAQKIYEDALILYKKLENDRGVS